MAKVCCLSFRTCAVLYLEVVALMISFDAVTDTLVLRNGDRLTGTITACADGTLNLATGYAGDLKVDLKQIESIESAPNVTVHAKEGVIEYVEVANDVIELDNAARPQRDDSEQPLAEFSLRKWTGTLDAAASLRSSEDTSTTDSNLALTLKRKWPEDTLTLEVNGAYGEVDSEVNTQRMAGSAKWQHQLNDRLYLLSDAGAEHDPAKRLELRLNSSGGAGYYVLKSEEQRLSFESGLQYAHEIWNKYSLTEFEDAKETARTDSLKSAADLHTLLTDPSNASISDWSLDEVLSAVKLMKASLPREVEQDPYTQDNINLRLGGNYEQKLFKKTVLAENVSAFPQIDDFRDYRLLSDLSLTTPLSQQLSLRVNLKTEYESDTGQDDDQFTNTLLMGLRYSF